MDLPIRPRPTAFRATDRRIAVTVPRLPRDDRGCRQTPSCGIRFCQRKAAALLLLAATSLAGPAQAASATVTLEEASRAALLWHEKLGVAAAERNLADLTRWQALHVMGPSVSVTAGSTRSKDEIAFPADLAAAGGFNPLVLQQEAVRGTLSVTQPLYVQQFWPMRELGRIDHERGGTAMRATEQAVLVAVADAYYEDLLAHALADVAIETSRLAAVETGQAQQRVAAGETIRSDVVRAQAEAARADEQVAETRGAAEIADQRLMRLTGMSPPFTLADSPVRAPDPVAVEPLVAAAFERNPGIRLAVLARDAAEEGVRLKKAALYPSLGLNFRYHLVDEPSFLEKNDFWDVTAAIEIPLFDQGGVHFTEIAAEHEKVAKANAELLGLRREVELGVRQAFVQVRTLTARETAAREEERLAVESHRLLSRHYAAGSATSVDVLGALTSRHLARANLAAVRYTRSRALAHLDYATGTIGDKLTATPAGASQ